MRSISRILFASCLVLVAACRGGGGDDGDDQPDGGVNPNDVSIYDIQNPDMRVPLAADVTVRGVVVTAIDEYAERADGTRVGTIWVQEPAGGEYSGVLVFGAPLDQVANLNVGDLIDLEGTAKTEFVLRDMAGMPIDTSGRTTTELEPGSAGAITITVVGTGGTAPQPQLVDALAIAMMDQAGKDAEWEKWEGVLIEVRNVSQISGVSSISGEANFLRFQVTGGLELDTGLAPFPMNAVRDTCYASIVGVGDYFFNHKILARATADIMGGGTGCPPPEESALCGDTLDNDYDGFADCDDFSCQATDPACVSTTTIADIQLGNVTGAVIVNNVFVTAVAFNQRDLWVSDALTAAPSNSILVYRGASGGNPQLPDVGPEIVPGATVNLSGSVTEFNGNGAGTGTLTEIVQLGGAEIVTFVSAPTAPPVPLAATTMITTMVDETNGEPYEGLLVTLTNVKVTQQGMAPNYTGRMELAGTTFASDDDILRLLDPVDTCYATITGVWTYQSYDELFGILPIAVTPGGVCP